MIGYIYKHTAPNGKSYIGQTYNKKGVHARWRNGLGYEKGTLFRRAIDKYGWDNFSHTILHTVEHNNIILLIKKLNTLEELEILNRSTITPNGYNNNFGGSNKKSLPSTRKKQSEIARKRYLNGDTIWNKGLDSKLQPRYGKKQTDIQKDAARISMKNSWETGKIKPRKVGEFKHSEETRIRISEIQKGKIGSNRGKSYYTNGIVDVLRFEAPEGFIKGRTNGHRK